MRSYADTTIKFISRTDGFYWGNDNVLFRPQSGSVYSGEAASGTFVGVGVDRWFQIG